MAIKQGFETNYYGIHLENEVRYLGIAFDNQRPENKVLTKFEK